MSWIVKSLIDEQLKSEKNLFEGTKEWGSRISVAIIWPGSYHVGMSSLGFLAIYKMLCQNPLVVVERFFAPQGKLASEYQRTKTTLLSMETKRPLTDFEIVAASLSVENDYWQFLNILSLGKINPIQTARSENDPLVLAGGIGVWSNPWPLAKYVDLLLTGDGEASWNCLISAWDDLRSEPLPKRDRIQYLSKKTPGVFIMPANFFSEVSGKRVTAVSDDGRYSANYLQDILKVKPAYFNSPDFIPPSSPIITADTEFSNVNLVEISRGCPHGCRFCLAGFVYRPARFWKTENIIKALPPLVENTKVGLVSPAVADHPKIGEILNILEDKGCIVSLSSLRITAISAEIAQKLASGKLQGVALAPEAGSERLRAIINKNITEKQILESASLLALAGLRRLKLYFMFGLPYEVDDDLEALIDLVKKIRKTTDAVCNGKGPLINVSIANFTPKPHTPFESFAMSTPEEFRRKSVIVTKALKKVSKTSVKFDPPNWSVVQGILAKGGLESHALMEALWKFKGSVNRSLRAINYDPTTHFVHQMWPENIVKPWKVIENRVSDDLLKKEIKKAENALKTKACNFTEDGNLIKESNCLVCKACESF